MYMYSRRPKSRTRSSRKPASQSAPTNRPLATCGLPGAHCITLTYKVGKFIRQSRMVVLARSIGAVRACPPCAPPPGASHGCPPVVCIQRPFGLARLPVPSASCLPAHTYVQLCTSAYRCPSVD